MKKLALSIVTVCIFGFTPLVVNAKPLSHPTTNTAAPSDTAGLYLLVNRLEEIKTLDKSKLNFAQKRALRKEVRDINGKLKAMGEYIYISIGALLLIILLLILLF